MTDDTTASNTPTNQATASIVGPVADVQTTPAAPNDADFSNPETLAKLAQGYADGSLAFKDTEDTVSSVIEQESAPVTPVEPVTPQEEVSQVDPQSDLDEDQTIKEIRIKPKSIDDQAALRIMKSANASGLDMTLEEAIAIVKQKKGETPSASTTSETPQEGSIEAMQAEIARIEEELIQAGEDFKTADIARLQIAHNKALVRLDRAERDAQVQAQQAERVAHTQQEQAFAAAESKAIELYPDAAVEGSRMWKAMEAIQAALEANNDPLVQSTDAPVVIAQMAAAQIGLAPTNAGRPVAVSKPKANQAPQPRPLQVGNQAPSGAVDGSVLVNQLTSAADIEAATQAMLKRFA